MNASTEPTYRKVIDDKFKLLDVIFKSNDIDGLVSRVNI